MVVWWSIVALLKQVDFKHKTLCCSIFLLLRLPPGCIFCAQDSFFTLTAKYFMAPTLVFFPQERKKIISVLFNSFIFYPNHNIFIVFFSKDEEKCFRTLYYNIFYPPPPLTGRSRVEYTPLDYHAKKTCVSYLLPQSFIFFPHCVELRVCVLLSVLQHAHLGHQLSDLQQEL